MAEPVAKVQTPVQRAQAELVEAGFHPVHQAALVRVLRRLVWPFIRPFHFHTLDRVAAADAAIARLEAEIRRLSVLAADTSKLHPLEVRLDRAEARADAAAGDIARLDKTAHAPPPDTARLEALEAGIHALRDARRPAIEQETARLDRIERRLDGLEIWADGHRHQLARMDATRHDDMARLVTLYTRFRSDLLAIGNRHAWVEERTAAAAEVAEQMRPLREGLFLTATPQGVFLLKAGELISESARGNGAWDPHIARVAKRAAETARGRKTQASTLLAIDAGAHFGLVTVTLAKLFDRVISFEPNIFNVTLLRANVVLNGLESRVEIRREALAAHEDSLSLAPSDRQEIPLPLDDQGQFAPGATSNLGAYSFVHDGTGLSEVRAIPLDKLTLDGVAFLKIDAQGADGAVLLGAMDTIARCRPWVVFEWERMLAKPFEVTLDEVEARFAGLEYRVTVLRRHNDKQADYLAIPREEADVFPESEAG